MHKTIAITGAGVISAIGVGKESTLQALLHGTSGIEHIKYLHTRHQEFPVGEVKLSNEELKQRLGCEHESLIARTGLLARVALGEALQEAQLHREQLSEVCLISGTTVGGMDLRELYHAEEKMGIDRLHAQIASYNCGQCTELIAQPFGNFAQLSTISTACSAAANAIITGANMIQCGMTDIVVAGGAECLSKFHFNGFNTLMLLDREPCRPFDRTRVGLNLGEGAAYLVLESLDSAKRRGVTPLCVLSGYGNKCDAYHQTASSPNGEGAYLAMTEALTSAGLRPQDIGYVNAHGTGTPNNDQSESQALRRVFGTTLPPISSTKSFTGHTTSASGAIEAVFCMMVLDHQFLPVNLNWREADEDCITPVTAGEQPHSPIVHVLSNAFGFGGNDSSLIFSKCEQ